jgi:hypothetical protein
MTEQLLALIKDDHDSVTLKEAKEVEVSMRKSIANLQGCRKVLGINGQVQAEGK